jgi:RimJ/RimL family protein N-acetyltransferase
MTPADWPLIDSWLDDAAKKFLPGGLLDTESPTMSSESYAVVGLVEDRPVGAVAFNFHYEGEAQVFILMDPQVRGRGLGRELMREALASTPAKLCTGDVHRDNQASMRCLLAAGMTKHVPDRETGFVLFAWTSDGRPFTPNWAWG